MKKTLSFVVVVSILLTQIIVSPTIYAEGTKDMTTYSGSRPYMEQSNSASGQNNLSAMHVYLKAGETVYLATSVSDARLYNEDNGKRCDWLFSNSAMGTNYTDEQLAYVNTADIYICSGNYSSVSEAIGSGATPGKNYVDLIDIPANSDNRTPGFIYDRTQESGGADIAGTGTGYKVAADNTIDKAVSGYVAGVKTNANAYKAQTEGIYTVFFFSSGSSYEAPVTKSIDDAAPFASTQGNSSVASFDISVSDDGVLQTGRVFTNCLYLNTGDDVSSLYTKMYAVTDDGYRYLFDFNGIDASEFQFYANRTGLLKTDSDGSTSSIMHSVRSSNNTFSDLNDRGIDLNYGSNYNLFFEEPSEDALNYLQIESPEDVTASASDITDFTYTGTGDTNAGEGFAGCGGTFSFVSSNVTADSYQIVLDFSGINGGKVILSNELVSGLNSIYWDGRDANGNYVPAGQYGGATIRLMSGEAHFDLIDADRNPNGIKVIRLNGSGSDSEKSTVYYNNSASGPSLNSIVGDGADVSLDGADSTNGAMRFTDVNTSGTGLAGDGDKSAIDVWTYGSCWQTTLPYTFKLADTSFTANVLWDNAGGSPAAGNPANVTLTLKDGDGNAVTEDALGNVLQNPVTLDTATAASYTWSGLNASATYNVEESSVAGYDITYGDVTDGGSGSLSQNITDTYKPTTLTLGIIWNMFGGASYPDNVKIHVYSDALCEHEITGSPLTLTSAGNWTATVSGLDSTLSYYTKEDAVEGFNSSTSTKAEGNAKDGFKSIYTNTYDDQTVCVAQTLVQWQNSASTDRPDKVLVTLYADGIKVDKDSLGNAITNPAVLSDDNSWYYAWTGLAGYNSSGAAIRYSFTETPAQGESLDAYSITTDPADPPLVINNLTSIIYNNTYKTTSFTADCVWNNGVGNSQPDSSSVRLQMSTDGGSSYTNYDNAIVLNSACGWSYQWTNLPQYTEEGQSILYRADETTPEGYTVSCAEVSGNATDGYSQSITNNYSMTTLSVKDVSTGNRPNSVNVTLLGNGICYDICTLKAGNNWTYKFTGLPVTDSDGNPVQYTVVQSAVTNYITTGGSVTGNASDGFEATFSNTYVTTGFTATASFVNGIKKTAPASVILQLQLSKDGGETYSDYGLPAAADESSGWAYHWTDIPAYVHARIPVCYRVIEEVPEGYSVSYGNAEGSVKDGYMQTADNTYLYTMLTVSDNTAGSRPDNTTVTLCANGTAQSECTLSQTCSWKHVFADLPIADAAGTPIVYTVKQGAVANYSTQGGTVAGNALDGYTASFINTYVQPADAQSAGTAAQASHSAEAVSQSTVVFSELNNSPVLQADNSINNESNGSTDWFNDNRTSIDASADSPNVDILFRDTSRDQADNSAAKAPDEAAQVTGTALSAQTDPAESDSLNHVSRTVIITVAVSVITSAAIAAAVVRNRKKKT